MLNIDLMGFIVRSRYKQNAEKERASLFHACKERKNGVNNINALKVDDHVVRDPMQIESKILNYFHALFNGYHNPDLSIGKAPFVPSDEYLDEFLKDLPCLDKEASDSMHKNILGDELDYVIKSCCNNKSPGLDGLTYEFYKKTWNIIKDVFMDVLQCQLDRLRLIDSDKIGATRLLPKVLGVPQIDELRPITLLNCDYRILSKLLVLRLKPTLPYLIRSGQLCTVEGKNILFGISNILSCISYANPRSRKACLISLDYFKAYDRVLLSFLIVVMKRMNMSQLFCSWIEMMHHGAQTRFILGGGLSEAISLSFSIRQGDPLAMLLFIIYLEPLLIYLEKRITGCILPSLKTTDAFCDDLNVMTSKEEDLYVIDAAVKKFESFSGAILSRNRKCEILGLGQWKGKTRWPLHYLRPVEETKVFGIFISNSYRQMLKRNWEERVKKFENVLLSWNGRHFESIYQRVEIVKTFALSRLYYLASILPLPQTTATRIEKGIGKFIWSASGKILRVKMEEMKLPVDKGGCGLNCITRMSKSLFLMQVLRMLKSNDVKSIGYLGYWVGEMLGEFRPGIEEGEHGQEPGDYFDYISDLLVEAQLTDLIDVKNWKSIRNKNLYSGLCMDLLPPKVERDTGASFAHSWKNLQHDCLGSQERELVFLLVHDKLPVRERLFRIGLANDPYCVWCLQHNVTAICDIEHFFCSCSRVADLWNPVSALIRRLLDSQTENGLIIRLNMMVRRCPGVVWIVAAYISSIWKNGDGGICAAELFGYLKFKFKTAKLGNPSQMEKVELFLI